MPFGHKTSWCPQSLAVTRGQRESILANSPQEQRKDPQYMDKVPAGQLPRSYKVLFTIMQHFPSENLWWKSKGPILLSEEKLPGHKPNFEGKYYRTEAYNPWGVRKGPFEDTNHLGHYSGWSFNSRSLYPKGILVKPFQGLSRGINSNQFSRCQSSKTLWKTHFTHTGCSKTPVWYWPLCITSI
ncbi:hypothetical protein O181_096363 [Austropuccinia psidii MF-1]|uniref:Uncharacterized protein n=1 Tax=Austropuccinia psidii MF-1 TaxID=1389203 RepID=A0A9Q3J6U4_9BASI|nr:hypothetical protein [Austropuccinia psidii MF-1]